MIIQKQILFIIFAIGFLYNTITCAENAGSNIWVDIITQTGSDLNTLYSLKNTSKQMRKKVHYFLSNVIIPLIKIQEISDANPLTKHYCTAIHNHDFFKNLKLLDQSIKINLCWDYRQKSKFIEFPNQAEKNNIKDTLRIMHYFFQHLTKEYQVSTLSLASLLECFEYKKYIVFLFYTNPYIPQFHFYINPYVPKFNLM